MADLLIPVAYKGLSSWSAHQRRIPKSSEPGTDLYCPIGTPVYAPETGLIYGYGTSIIPATGRWIGINFTNGMSWRGLHLSRLVKTSGFVRRGDLIGYSGATGYGKEDWSKDPDKGGAHVHVTLWPNTSRGFGYKPNGQPYTIDFMAHAGGDPASGGNSEKPIEKKKDFDMAEAIVSTPNGVVVHLRGGGKTNFPGPSEYNTFRDQIAFLRSVGATDAMPLPELAKVPRITWDTFRFLCGYFGAPVD